MALIIRSLYRRIFGTPAEKAEGRRATSYQHVPLAAIAAHEERERIPLDVRLERIGKPLRLELAQLIQARKALAIQDPLHFEPRTEKRNYA